MMIKPSPKLTIVCFDGQFLHSFGPAQIVVALLILIRIKQHFIGHLPDGHYKNRRQVNYHNEYYGNDAQCLMIGFPRQTKQHITRERQDHRGDDDHQHGHPRHRIAQKIQGDCQHPHEQTVKCTAAQPGTIFFIHIFLPAPSGRAPSGHCAGFLNKVL